jgi:membrane-associated phospholipid phosphatase
VTTTESDSQPAAPRRRAHQVADVVSIASDFGALWVAVSLAQVLLGRASLAAVGRRLGAAGITSLVLTRLLKHFYAVPRRSAAATTTRARTPSSSGFPSGHTLAAFVSAVVLPRTRRGRVLALTVASLVGWARVEVGHHGAADVVAGAVVGSTAGAALAVVLR